MVVGEPQRAFYGNQFGNTFPLFEHYGVPLWVPEVGGPIDPDNEAHDLIMSVFGGVSKGERNRIKVRVRAAMAAQAQMEGRYLGGRPPYGYLLIDAGPHPNPAKAADGKRLHALAHRRAGRRRGPADLRGVPRRVRDLCHCRTADPRRHPLPVRARPRPQPAPLRHRLVQERRPRDPDQPPLHRPTGVEPPAQGRSPHRRARRRARPHDQDAVERPGQVDLLRGDRPPADHRRPRPSSAHRTCWPPEGAVPASTSRTAPSRVYAFAACCSAACASAACKATGPTTRPTTGAGSPTSTPSPTRSATRCNVYLREDAFEADVNGWLTTVFAPHRLHHTVDQMITAQQATGDQAVVQAATDKIADANLKMARYRAALDACGDPEEIGKWTADAKAQRLRAEQDLRQATSTATMTRQQIQDLIEECTDIAADLRNADPGDMASTYRKLGLRLTYHPERQSVRAAASPKPANIGKWLVSEGGSTPYPHIAL